MALAAASLPFGNALFFGSRYLTDLNVFLAGSLAGLILYSISVTILTMLVRRIIAHYPNSNQTIQRTLLMILFTSSTAMAILVVELYVFSFIPLFHISFGWHTIGPMWLIIILFVCVFSVVLNLFYAYRQWKREQIEIEHLQHQTLQQQFDALKQQVNPHFLFNSLSSISALVSEDPAEAERFVDGLSKVYRYILQATNREQVSLREELTFIQTYARLLQIRYGNSLRIELPSAPFNVSGLLLPLSLQTLIDNALKHNRMSPTQPLVIRLSLEEGQAIRVVNGLQRKSRILATTQQGLTNLTIRYQSFTDRPITIEETDETFSVSLPLLPLDVHTTANP